MDKKVLILILINAAQAKDCFLLKDKKCGVKNVTIDNDYMKFPYYIKVDRYVGSCNNLTRPYSRVCKHDSVKKISVKVFDLISQQNELRNIESHGSCQCSCLLNFSVCNYKQKWNKDKCRCECLKTKKCGGEFFWNVINFRCESRRFLKSKNFLKFKKAALIEECKIFPEEMIDIKECKIFSGSKTVIKENCKPFLASSFLFVSVSIILTGIRIYFYFKSRKKDVSPY